MRDHLLFTLYGPLQAWGDVAVGEIRPVLPYPTRSGVLGLLAAALGIRRSEEEQLRSLNASFGLAVRVDASGDRMVDYHTVQAPSEKRKRRFFTRRDELRNMLEPHEDVNTILSQREYVADAAYTVCLWLIDDAQAYTLAQLKESLEQPFFVPYLGRKSCPPALPMRPEIIPAPNVREALSQRRTFLPDGVRRSRPAEVYAEEGHGVDGSFDAFSVRDMVLDHGRRQFALRNQFRLTHSGDIDAENGATMGTGG